MAYELGQTEVRPENGENKSVDDCTNDDRDSVKDSLILYSPIQPPLLFSLGNGYFRLQYCTTSGGGG